jgi:tRNA threonylcarbamoyladenosine biosynthesis protein TsaE
VTEGGRFETRSPDETEALARRVGASVAGRAAFLLVGDLGAGKTLFTRGLAGGLGIDPDEVSSPSS